MRVVDPVFPFTSPTVLHLSGSSQFAGATGALIILIPGVLRLWSCNFLEIIRNKLVCKRSQVIFRHC